MRPWSHVSILICENRTNDAHRLSLRTKTDLITNTHGRYRWPPTKQPRSVNCKDCRRSVCETNTHQNLRGPAVLRECKKVNECLCKRNPVETKQQRVKDVDQLRAGCSPKTNRSSYEPWTPTSDNQVAQIRHGCESSRGRCHFSSSADHLEDVKKISIWACAMGLCTTRCAWRMAASECILIKISANIFISLIVGPKLHWVQSSRALRSDTKNWPLVTF